MTNDIFDFNHISPDFHRTGTRAKKLLRELSSKMFSL